MTYLPNKSDDSGTESGSNDENNATPLLEISPKSPGDDDEPPAAGAAVIVTEPSGPKLSLAPTAEPKHEAEPESLTV